MTIMPVVVNFEWYFVVECRGCGKVSPIGPAPSPAHMPVVRAWADDVECPCGVRTHYEPGQIQRRQARPTTGYSPHEYFLSDPANKEGH